ncbi:fasciclin domain-containing protein [Carboxylicivirga linearis]|uniref:Fasciclin domain-containing protein n=1 Tax=Carboxylicivirga linearis TaxID=1628157 RepID=A0ABS5JT85_9BACT|nr:fasciclin domain-containing protein [Carboxylicivirga linearis]MBS2098089.1 fasciclin domain-containing protein [Carboxylicivirga linearis]
MKKSYLFKQSSLILTVVVSMMFTNCQNEEYTERTNYEQLIGEYLETNPDQFSTYVEVLEQSNSISFLKAYGAYTVFAPNNEAFSRYFEEQGKSGVNDFTEEELKDLVRFHTIRDTIASTLFIDGRMQTPSMYGQYLTTQAINNGDDLQYLINKYAEIDIKDKRLLNGVFYSVNDVLRPETRTLTEIIADDENYSIFHEALVQTTLADTLSLKVSREDENPRHFTVVAIPDEAYAKDEILSYNDLVEKYSDTGDPTLATDSLYLYMAYHILDHQLKYVSDLQEQAAHLTYAPLEVITIKNADGEVLINEDVFNGEIEPGYPINRDLSDVTANNGVLHVVDSDYGIKVRQPFPVYWEVTDQLEIRKMPGIYRKQSVTLSPGQLEDIVWPDGTDIEYTVGTSNSPYPYVLGDYLNVYLRPEVTPWIEFTTPVLVKGQYKLWTCTRNVYPSSGYRNPIFFVYFNDEVLPVIIDTNTTLSRDVSEEEYELQGLKWYSFWPERDSTAYRYVDGSGSGRFTGQLAGTINVETTGRHKVRFVGITAFAGRHLWLDQIHFIPTDMDQIWPKSNVVDNSRIYKEGLPPMTVPE